MTLIDMTSSAALIICVTLLIRALTLNRLRKWMYPALWSLSVFRLLIPFTLPSRFSVYSLINGIVSVFSKKNAVPVPVLDAPARITEIVPTAADAIRRITHNAANAVQSAAPEPIIRHSTTPPDYMAVIWLAGAVLITAIYLALYIVSILRLRRARPVTDEFAAEWLSANRLRLRKVRLLSAPLTGGPMTYGILRPRIVLPENTRYDDTERTRLVLMHEMAHIRRFDALFKLLMAAALCLHWYNPLVWVMYFVASRDIELACDESVIHRYGTAQRGSYAMILIDYQTIRKSPPIFGGFGTPSIDERIRCVMKTKNRRLLTSIVSVLLVAMIAMLFCSSAIVEDDTIESRTIVPKYNSTACGNYDGISEPTLIVSGEELLLVDRNPEKRTVKASTLEEFTNAINEFPSLNHIVVTDDIELAGEHISIPYGLTVTVAEGVVLTVTRDCWNFAFSGNLVNNGEIVLSPYTAIKFYVEPEKMGVIYNSAENSTIWFMGVFLNASELEPYLSPDSPYTSVACVSTDCTLEIDRDFTIPAGKELLLNICTDLHVQQEATLTILGKVSMHREPICDGKIAGTIEDR